MSHSSSTHISGKGPDRRRKRIGVNATPAVLIKRELKPIGSRAHLYYDPITGRKLSREERKR